MTLLKDLIEIPEHSSADDFVVKLTDARTRVASTLKEYVPTRAVVERMNTALGLVDAAVVGKNQLLPTYTDHSDLEKATSWPSCRTCLRVNRWHLQSQSSRP